MTSQRPDGLRTADNPMLQVDLEHPDASKARALIGTASFVE